ncbi:MAG: DNA recombination protein RmuC, partial [Bacteroidia bacterium]|nr:DNA recombination protein RmuC [Bacteroidia bacterium]NNM23981.1 DNA recombination protein RmuC [Flavobacteriaceae bacterium]
MSETFIVFLIGAISALAGAYVGNLIARLKSKSETGKMEERLVQFKEQEEKLNERFEGTLMEREEIRKEKDFLNTELVKRTAQNDNLEKKLLEQKEELEQLQEKFTKEFENLANKILENKSEKFTKQNAEKLDVILKPLQEKIDKFEKKVEETHKESIDRHAMLR